MTDAPTDVRVLPAVTDLTEAFWRGGEHGELLITRCLDCHTWFHPPAPRCPRCLGATIEAEPASGRGTVHTFTVNHHPWNPTHDHPYVIAVIELAEQEGLRLVSNVVDVEPTDVHIGMPVEVTFVNYEDVWLPLFRPVGTP